jgi:hypothetical protein
LTSSPSSTWNLEEVYLTPPAPTGRNLLGPDAADRIDLDWLVEDDPTTLDQLLLGLIRLGDRALSDPDVLLLGVGLTAIGGNWSSLNVGTCNKGVAADITEGTEETGDEGNASKP